MNVYSRAPRTRLCWLCPTSTTSSYPSRLISLSTSRRRASRSKRSSAASGRCSRTTASLGVPWGQAGSKLMVGRSWIPIFLAAETSRRRQLEARSSPFRPACRLLVKVRSNREDPKILGTFKVCVSSLYQVSCLFVCRNRRCSKWQIRSTRPLLLIARGHRLL